MGRGVARRLAGRTPLYRTYYILAVCLYVEHVRGPTEKGIHLATVYTTLTHLVLAFCFAIVKTFLRRQSIIVVPTQHRRFDIIIVRLPLRGIIIHQYYHEGK